VIGLKIGSDTLLCVVLWGQHEEMHYSSMCDSGKSNAPAYAKSQVKAADPEV